MVILFFSQVGEMLAQTNEVHPRCISQTYIMDCSFSSQGTNVGIIIGDMELAAFLSEARFCQSPICSHAVTLVGIVTVCIDQYWLTIPEFLVRSRFSVVAKPLCTYSRRAKLLSSILSETSAVSDSRHVRLDY